MRDAKEVAGDVIRVGKDYQLHVGADYTLSCASRFVLADRREVWAEAMRRAKEKLSGCTWDADCVFDALDELEKEGPHA